VITIKNPMTAQIPSAFGMPACARSFGWVPARATAIAGTGLVQGYFPGTSAWRPPTC
jgi:hypothetical protein